MLRVRIKRLRPHIGNNRFKCSKVGVSRIGFSRFRNLRWAHGFFCNAVVTHGEVKQFAQHRDKSILTGRPKPKLSEK